MSAVPVAAQPLADCNPGEFCEWTGANYSGTVSTSLARPGVCFNGSNYTKSLRNRTSHPVELYGNVDCTGLVTTIPTGENRPTISFVFQSYIGV
ncbi:peptidase inhibitor family I36 protein [Streptomyces sp. HD1123-B1]|uniref:peptidase inhibitor family I36 protein n=1 Tax=Streptomyces huangiella TaxID=3228804 RepID=UPI003D7CC393